MDRPDGFFITKRYQNSAALLVRSLGQGLRLGVPKEKPTSRCPAGKAANRRTPVRGPQEKLLPRSGKPGSITPKDK